jgi:hypothetical protein
MSFVRFNVVTQTSGGAIGAHCPETTIHNESKIAMNNRFLLSSISLAILTLASQVRAAAPQEVAPPVAATQDAAQPAATVQDISGASVAVPRKAVRPCRLKCNRWW